MSMKILQAFAALILLSAPILGKERVMVCEYPENDTSEAELQELVKAQNCREENGLPFGGTCYILPDPSNTKILSYEQGVQKCKARGAEIAEIHSAAHQQAIQDAFVSRIPTSVDHSNLVVGMTYQSSTQTLRFRSGKEVAIDQFKWHSGYPTGSGTLVGTQVSDRRTEGYRWFFNYPEGSKFHGVLCEKSL